MPPQTIKTSLDYLHPSAFPSGRATAGTLEFCRIAPDRRPVEIEDVRERTEEFSLDVHGFQFLRHESPIFASFRDEGLSTSHKELSKRIDSSEPDSSLVPLKTPSRRVHADQSEAGAYQLLKNSITPDQVERVLQGHWAIINIWRPLKPVPCDPLAVADARSVPDKDLFPVYIQRPHKEPGNFYNTQSAGQGVETLFGQYGPGHKWYYMSDMTQYDIILIKVFDSKNDSKTARRTPHAAFIDPHTSEGQAARESLEMRCLVCFGDGISV
ncbi:hypothetical protein BDV24DRAFT_165765 [Aspergillus arachidicola]|uniref:GA4 desaturase family protein n=1 Tax=Aspergillus arachidicola TaxID=656916 RepID=A0A5N6Y3H5_9EURO|nr:hypothetical protein BDV24DRAFT_165765 [Aspergillus arachidicola]